MSDHSTSTDATARNDVDADTIIDTFPRVSLTPDSEYIETIELPAEPADTTPTVEVLRSELADPYPYDLFSHQADALNALETGDNVAVTTSTSSGKTHIYGLQIARNLLDAGVLNPDGTRATEQNDASTALCVYPMKALTKDQQEALDDLYEQLGLDIRVEIYDGDVTDGRRAIREQADVILTNFAGLNIYLEHHDKWSRFYSALDLIAIDESHTYTGLEGIHVAWILRRMQRVADYWGGNPQYILTSATIGNPRDHSEELINAPVTVIDDDGSPHGPRDVILWNPPPRDKTQDPTPEEESFDINIDDGTDSEGEDEGEEFVAERVPASVEAPKVFNHLTSRDIRTLLFCESRKLTELSIQRADEHRQTNPREYDRSTTVGREAYNAGLGRRTRHSREHQFKTGVLTGLATTSALELGIDIGSLDATVLMGYPGQRQSFWQRIGRAGREASRSLAVLVGDHRTLDQYILTHPEYLLENDVEDAVVDTSNNSVFATHVLAAADEIALDESDIGMFADEDRLRAAVKMWREAGFVDGYLDAAVHYAGPSRPQTRVNLYGTTGTDYRLQLADDVDRDKWGLPDDLDLEPIEQNRAYRDYHEGAVRLQNGQQFEVVNMDEDRPQPIIELKPVDCEYYTRTRNKVNVLDAESEESREVNGFTLHFGRGTVLVHHHSYDQLYIANSDPKQQAIPTETPPILMDTQLCWVEVPEDVETALTHKYQDYGIETGVDPENTGSAHLGYIAGLHAAEHATIQTAPLELRVDKNDLGGLATLVMDTHYAHPNYDDITDSIGDSFEAATHALEQRTQQLTGRTASGWFIYDGVDGGLGFARAIYENFEVLAERARDQLRDCNCGQPNGCPACTFDENCGNDNKPLLRASAIDVLNQLLGDDTRDDLAEHLPDDKHGGDRRPVIFYS
ncbi:DEAD/DEAH box helicase domain-containing protein [Natrinema hispanicum]|uniref:DEAD/DEAH box helicase domain-containing protein n=1 Tax=Natrinema hispanicum TaxID=392421 RepID=A0A482YCG2_9EURY|nr:DEAD/DEAH box helicase [Natrinema hispanicum]RZV10509.1 DEAD/DEAH box helicase domain-containing protein [Natrinema hispanicum]